MSELKPCPFCGSTNIKRYTPYGVESVHCKDCHVSLRLVDWNRVMSRSIPEGFALVPVEPTEKMVRAGFTKDDDNCLAWRHPKDCYRAMLAAAKGD